MVSLSHARYLPLTAPLPDFSTERMDALLSELRESGFRPYVTSVGGAGLGLLTSGKALDVEAPGAAETNHSPLQKAFHDVNAEGLEAWAEQTGEWLYI
jgi:hypothetical protein